MLDLLVLAGKVAASCTERKKNFLLGAVGVRKDGAIVTTKNGAVISSTFYEYRVISDAHAEMRNLKKLGKDGILYVARVLKKNGDYAMAKPCCGCQLRIQYARVKRVYYTVNNNQYGVWDVLRDHDQVYYC